MRTIRNRTIRNRTAAVATAALLAGLSLTACQSDDKSNAAAPADGGKANATASKAPAATPSSGTGTGTGGNGSTTDGGSGKGSASGSGKNSGGSSGKGTSGGTGGDSTSLATCTGDNTKAVVSKVSRPINHLLLTITNTGSRTCAAYNAPFLRFDDAQSPTQFIEDSRPQAVVTLAPGESAYAAVVLTGEPGAAANPGRIAKHLTVSFAHKGAGSTGAPAELALPADTYIEDDTAKVTYWQSDMADALTY
ncbi:DUF4232 domain-containing protein [Streptomyces sp. NPDC091376]|uniref:DUF4232 domain-containing protein n=1 Tax=Streptomyces sp. NPDC091376 TaxID=3365994 RepID=UPI00381A14B4